MATLRNKTTEDGSIVRWAPHPDHNRPSTYQVTQRALSFLREIGIEAPRPGDETEIPWDVCRPLRLLGDLHFKSETPGTVDTRSVGRSSYTLGRNLKPRHRQQLRQYIEDHPNYASDAKRQLQGDVKKLPEAPVKSDADDSATTESSESSSTLDPIQDPVDHQSLSYVNFIQVGQITRFSNSNNAMVKSLNGTTYNISKIPKRYKHDWVAFTRGWGGYRLCISPQKWDDRYRNKFRENAEFLERRTGFENLRDLQRIYPRGGDDSLEQSTTWATVIAVRDDIGLAYKGPHTIIVESPGLRCGLRLRVEIEETWGTVARASPYVDADGDPEVGDSITVTDIWKTDGLLWGSADGQLVRLPVEFDPQADSIRVGVSEKSAIYLVGSVEALSPEERPVRGDVVTVRNGRLVDYGELPLQLPSGSPVLDEPYRVKVTAVDQGGVTATFTSELAEPCSVGDTIAVEPQRWGPESVEAVLADCPVRIENPRYLPDQTLEAKITEFADTGIIAEFIGVQSIEGSEVNDLATLFEAGLHQLRSENYADATTQFALAVDLAETEGMAHDSVEWIRFYECLSFAADHYYQGQLQSALRKLDTEFGEANGIAGIEEDEIEALRLSLQVSELIHRIERQDDAQATSLRSKARKRSKEVIEIFESISERDGPTEAESIPVKVQSEQKRPVPHPVITRILHTAIGDLLIPPPTVTAYFEEHGTGSQYFQEKSATQEDEDETPENTPKRTDKEGDEKEDKEDQKAIADPVLKARKRAHQSDPISLSIKRRARTDIETHLPEAVSKYIQIRAGGQCERCREPAPFQDAEGEPYLELHHQDEPTADDTVESNPEAIVALCPTCHAQAHHGN